MKKWHSGGIIMTGPQSGSILSRLCEFANKHELKPGEILVVESKITKVGQSVSFIYYADETELGKN